MATRYVVIHEDTTNNAETDSTGPLSIIKTVEAPNAQTACRKVAEGLGDTELAAGVTLRAVPERNWTSGRHTFKAKTERKLLRS